MALITLQVLDGADRGRVFHNLSTPVTVGREEGNTIQLNDERISRFHLKIQEDQGRLVLTDLQSTNGTKVNGEDMQLKILRFGDMIALGRSVLLFGSREQIAERLANLRRDQLHNAGQSEHDARATVGSAGEAQASGVPDPTDPHMQQALQRLEKFPDLPAGLTPGQAAQLSDIMNFLHVRLRLLIESVQGEKNSERVNLDQRHWQNLIDLQMQVATYLRQIGDPSHHG
ncbi:FHA domain-containing protein FhaA [Planctomycetales bacterium 10988]|nr:FHA domain-containing protein FhaA [Planctomycetales bacterium 10988]